MKKIKQILASLLALILLVAVYQVKDIRPAQIIKEWVSEQAHEEKVAGYTEVSIVRVVDGDTLVVRENNTDYKVRLIGVDTPENVHKNKSKNTKEGIIASQFTKDLLPVSTPVFLEFDKSPKDKYDRVLAYVWLEKPEKNPNKDQIKTKMVNGILLDKGYAKAKAYKPNIKYKEIFEQIEKGE